MVCWVLFVLSREETTKGTHVSAAPELSSGNATGCYKRYESPEINNCDEDDVRQFPTARYSPAAPVRSADELD
jgi:hypothetical protein